MLVLLKKKHISDTLDRFIELVCSHQHGRKCFFHQVRRLDLVTSDLCHSEPLWEIVSILSHAHTRTHIEY